MEKFDTIIIGSGVGGLSTAICLARASQKVLVLEQHYVPGGWAHSFTLNGQRFSPGVHYVGLIDEGQTTNEMYRGLGIANDIVFFRMNKSAYEHCLINGEKFDVPAGIENWNKTLATRFPEEAKNNRSVPNQTFWKICLVFFEKSYRLAHQESVTEIGFEYSMWGSRPFAKTCLFSGTLFGNESLF